MDYCDPNKRVLWRSMWDIIWVLYTARKLPMEMQQVHGDLFAKGAHSSMIYILNIEYRALGAWAWRKHCVYLCSQSPMTLLKIASTHGYEQSFFENSDFWFSTFSFLYTMVPCYHKNTFFSRKTSAFRDQKLSKQVQTHRLFLFGCIQSADSVRTTFFENLR